MEIGADVEKCEIGSALSLTDFILSCYPTYDLLSVLIVSNLLYGDELYKDIRQLS